MREILFRGKRTDNDEWVEGSLITGVFLRGGQDIPYILCPEKAEYDCFEDFLEENGIFEVYQETVCQYTGLYSKNGKKIFEGDVVKLPKCENDIAVFVLRGCNYFLRGKRLDYEIGECDGNYSECFEVVGNIFDNPDLIN